MPIKLIRGKHLKSGKINSSDMLFKGLALGPGE